MTCIVQAQSIGHATLETPDLKRATDYFVFLKGLSVAEADGHAVHLTTCTGKLSVTLRESQRADCTRLSFEVAPDCDFRQVIRDLDRLGIKSEMRTDPFPGTPECLSIADPNGTGIDLFKNGRFLISNRLVAGVGPLKLGHVAMFSANLEKSLDFYKRVLGFRVSDWLGDFFVFMRCNPDHHTVNFFRAGSSKLHHIAFELKDMAHIQHACEALTHFKIPIGWGPLRVSGPGHNVAVFHRNPDDHAVEYYCELDQMKSEQLGYFDPRPWHADKPQLPRRWDPELWECGWGTPRAPEFNRPIP